MSREPTIIVQFVTAVIALAGAYGISTTREQGEAIVAVVAIVDGVFLLSALVIRSKVTPTETAERQREMAFQRGKAGQRTALPPRGLSYE
ncbi:MAG: hypothetical protein M3Q74_09745 [Pseudomonadota bacterium]|nr:hypothetical protein [Pseudomonadota bacterium]